MEAQDIETLKGQLNYHVIIQKKKERETAWCNASSLVRQKNAPSYLLICV